MSSKKKVYATQERLPGVGPNSDRVFDALIVEYKQAKDQRMDALRVEITCKDKIIAAMHERGINFYENDEMQVRLEPPKGKEKIKVQIKEREEAGGDE